MPAMVAETYWDPLQDEALLEARCRMIWEEKVGGWERPVNPVWNEKIPVTFDPDVSREWRVVAGE